MNCGIVCARFTKFEGESPSEVIKTFIDDGKDIYHIMRGASRSLYACFLYDIEGATRLYVETKGSNYMRVIGRQGKKASGVDPECGPCIYTDCRVEVDERMFVVTDIHISDEETVQLGEKSFNFVLSLQQV